MDVTYKGEAEDPDSEANVTKTMEITDITDSEVEWKLRTCRRIVRRKREWV